MPASPFLDTNVLIYSIAENDPRSDVAEALLAAGGVVSVQVLNEFVATARRKLEMSWDEIIEALGAIRTLCPSPRAVAVDTHDFAVRIARTYNFHIYDAMVVASALEANCDTLYTEDLQDGQVVEERLTIRNPFKLREAPTMHQ
jgi:predicted nucleic acid-binding protein